MSNLCYMILGDQEIKAPGVTVDAAQLGAPDPRLFERTFRAWITQPENLQYFYNIVPVMTDELNNIVIKVLKDEERDFGTVEDSLEGVKQMYLNRHLLERSMDATQYKVKADMALIFMAGPSVDYNMDHIKAYLAKNPNVLILACDAILRRLLKEGIDPHFVFTSERVPLTAKFLDKSPKTKATLVCSQMSNILTTSQWEGPLSFLVSLRPESEYCLPTYKKRPYNPGVAQQPLVFLLEQDVKHVVMVGADFCFDDRGTHSNLGDDSNDVVKQMKPQAPTFIDCIDGVNRPTNPGYVKLRQTLDSLINELPFTVNMLVNPSVKFQPAVFNKVQIISNLEVICNKVNTQLEIKPPDPTPHIFTWPTAFKETLDFNSISEGPEKYLILPSLIKEFVKHLSSQFRNGVKQDGIVSIKKFVDYLTTP